MTLSRADVRRLLDDHGLRPHRSLGQNFVVDANTVRRIARVARVGPGQRVLEIGAGLGSLTLALSDTGAEVLAVEVDRGLAAVLREVVADRAVSVVEADALTVDFTTLLGPDDRARPWVLVANLPYNVATPIVISVLESAPTVARLVVMVQREVAERWVATAGQSAYGAVSVKIAYWARASILGRVPSTVFLPRPKVESALVKIERRDVPAVDPARVTYDRLCEVVGAGFSHRRKMLRRSLLEVVGPDAFAAAGVSPQDRAEDLTVEQWGDLASWGLS